MDLLTTQTETLREQIKVLDDKYQYTNGELFSIKDEYYETKK